MSMRDFYIEHIDEQTMGIKSHASMIEVRLQGLETSAEGISNKLDTLISLLTVLTAGSRLTLEQKSQQQQE